MKRKKICRPALIALLLCLCVSGMVLLLSAGEIQTEGELSEKQMLVEDKAAPAEAAAEEAVTEAPEGLGDVLDASASRQLWSELIALLLQMDPEQAKEYYDTICAVITSEEFDRLMEYPQMQALVDTALEESAEFVLENKELTGEILVKLGVNEKAAGLICVMLDTFDY